MPKRKYARIGDEVTVAIAKKFVRCGYPLCVKDIMTGQLKEVDGRVKKIIKLLSKETAEKLNSNGLKMFDGTLIDEFPTTSARVYGMLSAAVANYMLEEQNWGGNERKIYEMPGFFNADWGPNCVWTVVGKRFVKTGTRFAAKSWQGYEGEWDYEPGGLNDGQTHCVYKLSNGHAEAEILAINCKLKE